MNTFAITVKVRQRSPQKVQAQAYVGGKLFKLWADNKIDYYRGKSADVIERSLSRSEFAVHAVVDAESREALLADLTAEFGVGSAAITFEVIGSVEAIDYDLVEVA